MFMTQVLSYNDLIKEVSYHFTQMKGKGTKEHPYQITNVYQLQSIRKALNAHYILSNNISAEETKYWEHNFIPIGINKPFTGSLNGNGHTISNIFINQNENRTGLFSVIDNEGLVHDLHMDSMIIYGYSDIGGIVGWNKFGYISDVIVENTRIKGKEMVGGICGVNSTDSVVKNSNFKKSFVCGEMSVGGFIGNNNGYLFHNKPNNNDISVLGESNLGLYVGMNNGVIKSHQE